MFFLSQKSKKRSVVVLIAVFGFVSVFGLNLFRPSTAYAQIDVNQGTRNVTDQIGSTLLSAGLAAVVNGASYFMRKIAYDTAKYVAAGGKGQKPLAFQEGFGKYLANTALDSAGSAIEQFGEPFGLNLCKPPDLRLQIGLQVNISKIYEAEYGGVDGEGGPQPRCSWNDFTENWENSPDTMFNDQALLEKFNVSLKTSQGDLGTALDIFGKVDNITAKKQMADQLDRLEGQGFKAVKDLISGDVRTPAQIIKKETDTITGGKQAELSAGQIAGIYGAGAVQILPMALGIFANTLVNSLLQNILEKGLLPSKGSKSSVVDFYSSTFSSNREIADAAFSYLIVGIPQRPLTAYDVVAEYSACDSNPGLNNCVMDSGLVDAVNRARTEAPLTIGEALELGLLHKDFDLIGVDRVTDNTDLQKCHSDAYCLSNVQKLRKARILPLGFEIAVRKSDPDKPWKLGDVVGDGKSTGFYDCDPSGKPSVAHPFCKLIDPNWIIKAPEARCEVRVHGPELLTPTAAIRREECVDFSTCLATDATGKCIGFGYCMQEENIWKMPGTSCDEQFNTCKTYKATDGAIASYLSRTLDVESCNINSVGCLAYSTDKSGDAWKQTSAVDPELTFEGRTQAIHLNARASSLQCPSSAEGCSLFVDSTITDRRTGDNDKIFLKKAPDYLGCYDVTPETEGSIEWPQTKAELTKLALQKSATCSQFATACIPEEVGCQEYRPTDGGVAVTGVIGGSSCPLQCVGYETFKQEATTFEPSKFPLNFIAANAKTCSIQHVGCDEFTNIGAAAQGGESLEFYTNLKHCERPNGQNGKVFYSWEGSESQGYILKRHTLLQMTEADASYIAGQVPDIVSAEFPAGSPAYVEDTKTAVEANYNRCNQASYNLLVHNIYDPAAAHPDCRAFYDSSGGIYYRILRDTVTVSNACTPLRKTNSELFSDTSISDATVCQTKGGLWENENNQCKRCYNGGRYELNENVVNGGGSCVYQSIQSEATSCPATANGCRSYIGNTGNNIYEVLSPPIGFEPTNNSSDALNEAEAGWSGNVSVEAESLQVGLHSLRVNGPSTGYTLETGKLQAGAWYELRFWARGNASFGLSSMFRQNGQQVGSAFTFDSLTNSEVPAPLTAEWQEYRVGPVQFTGDASKAADLSFAGQVIGTPGVHATYSVTLTGLKPALGTTYKAVLTVVGSNKIGIIQVVRDVTGFDLTASKAIVDAAALTPTSIKENITIAEAMSIQSLIGAADGEAAVEIFFADQSYRDQVINELATINGVTQAQATAIVDNAPSTIKQNISSQEADGIVSKIGLAGGIVAKQVYSQTINPITTNQFYFLDNVSLVQIGGASSDHIFRIKNSWRTPEGYEVPLACDSTPNNGLPGEYLGCRSYTQSNTGQAVNLTGFDRLCRAEAIGCRAVVDTQNTVTGVRPEEKQAYGVVCRKPGGRITQPTPCTVVLNESAENKPSYSCTVERGNQECRIKTPVVLGNTLRLNEVGCISDGAWAGNSCEGNKDKLFIDQSTVVIRADSDAIYLTQQTAFTCAEQQLGCMKVAGEKQNIAGNTVAGAYTYTETSLKNDPRTYGEVLCSDDEVGCAEFKHDTELVYFKDPKLTGNSLCVYQPNTVVNGKSVSGWFMDGVGKCSGGSETGKLCKASGECGTGGTCNTATPVPCYSEYLSSDNAYGLWSQGTDPRYSGFVGVCNSGDNGCTELVDRVATSPDHPNGKPYYVIMNDRLKQSQGQCEGKVSQKAGCVLFDQTEDPRKKWNTSASYADSEIATPPNSPVLPSEVDTKDANIILKVARDRQCSEWLACVTAATVYDEEGNPHSVCQDYAACTELGPGSATATGIGPEPTGACTAGGWVDSSSDNTRNTRLTEEEYIKRPVAWNSPEYSGYSLFGAYNPSDYVYLLFSSSTEEAYLAYEMSGGLFTQASGFEKQGCRQVDAEERYVKKNGDICGYKDDGRCYSQRCLYPIDGTFTFAQGTEENNVAKMLKQLQPGICKGYPETDSPFSVSVASDPDKDGKFGMVQNNQMEGLKDYSRTEYTTKKEKYARANVCQPGTPSKDCSCEYIKVEYKNGTTDYWPTNISKTDDTKIPKGVCTSGETEGMPCDTDAHCSSGEGLSGSTCSLVSRQGTSLGLKGLCLEYDFSRPIGPQKDVSKLFESFQCLTWLPIDVSTVDIHNLFEDAGYNPSTDSSGGGEAYCTESTGRGSGYYDTSLETDDNISSLGEFGFNRNLDNPTVPDVVDRVYLYKSNSGVDVLYSARGTPNYWQVFDASKTTDYGVYVNDNGTDGLWGDLLRMLGKTDVDKIKLMRTIQVFAWKHIGPSSRILRLDTKGAPDLFNDSFLDTLLGTANDYAVYDALSSTYDDRKTKDVYAFAPRTEEPDGPISNDTGVLMHPPRLFSSSRPGIGDYYMNPQFGQYLSQVGTASFSADFEQSVESKNFIYIDNKVESNLREQDLESVHFVPIEFPGGSDGYNPALLTTEVSIQFKYLQDNGVEAKKAGVPAYVDGNGEGDPHYYNIYNAEATMSRFSYLLERTQDADNVTCDGLLSFCDYASHALVDSGGTYWGNYLSAITDENKKTRTEVYHRYVTLIFAPEDSTDSVYNFKPLRDNPSKELIADNDPFKATCDLPNSDGKNRNWLAIGMDFNKEGEFLGYISRWCMNTNRKNEHEANGIRFATIAKLQDRCVEYKAVVDSGTQVINKNKAWTDRVWIGSSYVPDSDSKFLRVIRNSAGDPSPGIKPYGSLKSSIATADILRTDKEKVLPLFGFSDYKFGVPYQCQGGDGFGVTLANSKYMFKQDFACILPKGESQIIATAIGKNGDTGTGSEILRQLFLKYYVVKDIAADPPDNFKDDTDINADKSGDTSLFVGTAPPRIFAINPETCDQGSTCTAAGADEFTLNSRNYSVDDEPIIGKDGSYTAIIKFFAYADDNRMPIKRVKINWDEGEPEVGLYQNHKPYCAPGNETAGDIGRCTGTQLTCKDNTDCAFIGGTCDTQAANPLKFGDAPRACVEKYFEYFHVYRCAPGDQRLETVSGIGDVCVFEIGVQILDNWGWCNASDANGNPLPNGLYNDDPDEVLGCDDDPNAFTFYKDKIYVRPAP